MRAFLNLLLALFRKRAPTLLTYYMESFNQKGKEMSYVPEGCKLVAVHDGSGQSATWTLCVESEEGEEVALLGWPKSWPDWVTPKFLEEAGFECVTA